MSAVQTLATAQEEVYYSDSIVWLTDRRVILNGITHWQDGIKSAELGTITPAQRLRTLWLFVPLVASFLLQFYLQSTLDTGAQGVYAITLYVVIVFLPVLFIFIFLRSRRIQHATLHTINFNRRKLVFASTDRQYTVDLLARINLAIEGRVEVLERLRPYVPEWSSAAEGERVYYSDPQILVTDNAIYSGQESYPMHDVKSTSLGLQTSRRASVLIVFALLLLSSFGFMNYAEDALGTPGHRFQLFFLDNVAIHLGILFSATVLSVLSMQSALSPGQYIVFLNTVHSRVEVCLSVDKTYMETVRAAVKRAVSDNAARVHSGG